MSAHKRARIYSLLGRTDILPVNRRARTQEKEHDRSVFLEVNNQWSYVWQLVRAFDARNGKR